MKDRYLFYAELESISSVSGLIEFTKRVQASSLEAEEKRDLIRIAEKIAEELIRDL